MLISCYCQCLPQHSRFSLASWMPQRTWLHSRFSTNCLTSFLLLSYGSIWLIRIVPVALKRLYGISISDPQISCWTSDSNMLGSDDCWLVIASFFWPKLSPNHSVPTRTAYFMNHYSSRVEILYKKILLFVELDSYILLSSKFNILPL